MRIRCLAILLALLASAAGSPARAETRLGDGCDLAVLGVADTAEFLRFDRALKTALDAQDAAALALLVRFPLRVNHADGGRISLDNVAALQSHFAQAFDPAVRSAVTRQESESLFCKADGGVMYGDGEVWVDRVDVGRGRQFRVTPVNVPAGAAAKARAETAPKPRVACSTDQHRVVIDGRDDAAPRYRSWNRPHAPPDPPALDLVGKADGEGSGSCFHRIWRFRNGDTEYVLSEPGCSPDTPKGARAELEVLVAGRSRLRSWCY